MFYQNSFKIKIGLFVGTWVSSDQLITTLKQITNVWKQRLQIETFVNKMTKN